jgi:hypothetical protein
MATAKLDRSKPKITLRELKLLKIAHGGHQDRSNGLCVMEAVAWLAGEKHSDSPSCVCPVIGAFLRSWNDALPSDDVRRRLLAPLAKKVIDTKATKEIEFARAMLCVDWFMREFAPAWLDLVPSLKAHADLLREAKPVQSYDDLERITAPLRAAQKDADAAWSAARSAAWSAARSAAESAAESAAWSAARSAITPTVHKLQQSAVALVERMCAVK